jgi:hypothetical protein
MPPQKPTCEYTAADVDMCRARERQLIREAEHVADLLAISRRRMDERRRVEEHAAWRASVRERIAGADVPKSA